MTFSLKPAIKSLAINTLLLPERPAFRYSIVLRGLESLPVGGGEINAGVRVKFLAKFLL